MAILYDGTDDYHSHPLTVLQVGTTLTMGCWVKCDGSSDLRPLMVRVRPGGKGNDRFEGLTVGFDDLGGGGPSGGSDVHAVTWVNSADYDAVAGTTDVDDGGWHYVAGVFRRGSGNEREIFVDGVQESASGVVKTVSGTRFSYAVLERASGNSRFFDPELAEPAIWNVALTAVEIASLAAGALSCEVRPANLKIWNRFIGVPPQGMMVLPTSWTTGSAPVSSPHAPVSEAVPGVG